MNIKQKIKDALLVLITPSCWIMNDSYSQVWDEKLTKLAQKYDFQDFDGYRVKLGQYKIWATNYPFACFSCKGFRPKRSTVIKLYKKMKPAREKYYDNLFAEY